MPPPDLRPPRASVVGAHLSLALVALFWGGNVIVGRAVTGRVPPLDLSFWRWAVALAAVLPISARAVFTHRAAIRAEWAWLLLLAGLSVTAFNTLLYLALRSTTALNATLVLAAMPAMILTLARPLLGERVRTLQACGIALSLAGVLWVITQGAPRRLFALHLEPGDLLVLSAALSWALYSVLLRRRPPKLPPLTFLTVQIGLGVLLLAPFYVSSLVRFGGFSLTGEIAAAFAYLAVFPSLVAVYLWNRGVAIIGASAAGPYNNLQPLYAAALGGLFLAEPLAFHHVVGFALIATGIMCASLPGRAR